MGAAFNLLALAVLISAVITNGLQMDTALSKERDFRASMGTSGAHRAGRPQSRQLSEAIPYLDNDFSADWNSNLPGQTYSNTFHVSPGDKLNFTFAASKYVPSSGFIVNATALQRYPGMPRLALWCGVGDSERRNDSAPLPTPASALKPPAVANNTVLLIVNFNETGLPAGPGLRAGAVPTNSSTTGDGMGRPRPYTCVVQYGNSSDANANSTADQLRIALTLRYPNAVLAPREQAAVGTIYKQCCNGTYECLSWKRLNTSRGPQTDFCSVPGSICHANGTLAVLDTTVLDLHCDFPYQVLANLTSLSSLVLKFSRPEQAGPAVDPPATWADFFNTVARLRNLQSLSIRGYQAFAGSLLGKAGASRASTQATVCDMARGRLSELNILDPLGEPQTSLNGTLPACLLDSLSQLTRLSVGSTALTGIEQPQAPSIKLREFTYISNYQNTGDIPAFLGGLASLAKLDMSSNNFNGSIPESLGNLTSLRHLLLCCNGLSGTAPARLAASPVLEAIELYENALIGSVPASIGSSTSLRSARLSVNNFSGSLPPFAPGSQLELLRAHGNYLNGSLPASLGSLTRLRELNLFNNTITGSLPPAALGALQDLRQVNMASNLLSGPLDASWTALPKLRKLEVFDNRLNGSLPANLFRAPALRSINLQANSLSGTLPAQRAFRNQSSLERLELEGNYLAGSLPRALCSLSNLTRLSLGHNQLTGSLPECLGQLGNLEVLHLTSNQLSGSIAQSFGVLAKSLDRFTAGSNNFTGPLPAGFSSSLVLKTLDLSNNSFSGSLPPSYGNMTSMRSLKLGSNNFQGTIPREWGALAMGLDELSLADNSLTGEIPSGLATMVPIVDLSDNGFQIIPAAWYGPELKGRNWWLLNLDIGNNNLTGLFPDRLARQIKRPFRFLDLSNNNISGPLPKADNATAPFFPALEYFNVSGNRLTGPIPEEFSRTSMFNASSHIYDINSFFSLLFLLSDLGFDVSNNQLSGPLPSFLSSDRVPPLLQPEIYLGGNAFTCPNSQDLAYLNVTSCVSGSASTQSASSAPRPGSASAGGLSKGAVAGIAIAAVCAAVAALTGLAFLVLSRRRRAQGWQKESLDGHSTGFSGGRQPDLELTNSSTAH